MTWLMTFQVGPLLVPANRQQPQVRLGFAQILPASLSVMNERLTTMVVIDPVDAMSGLDRSRVVEQAQAGIP